MNRALRELAWPTVGGLVAAVIGATIASNMRANHDFYRPKPENYTQLKETPQGNRQLQALTSRLNGKSVQVYPAVSTIEFFRIENCDVPAGTPLRQLTLSSRGGNFGASALLPQGLCVAKNESPYSDRNNHFSNTPFGIPLWALPMDQIAKQYGADTSGVNPAELSKFSDWKKNANLRRFVSKKDGINIALTDAMVLSEKCTVPAQTNLELKDFLLNDTGEGERYAGVILLKKDQFASSNVDCGQFNGEMELIYVSKLPKDKIPAEILKDADKPADLPHFSQSDFHH